MKNISILGSTGSIGTQALEIVREFPDRFNVVCLTANSNTNLLMEQIKEFKPKFVSVMNEEKADLLADSVDVPVEKGMDGLVKAATFDECDTVLTSVVGSVGVLPTVKAIEAGKNIALANKETLVTAGSLVMDAVRRKGVNLMPIDSEHSAIFQCLNGENKSDVKRIILTCSGGSFRNLSLKEMEKVTVKDALNHPTWNMGGKITIDSATLMNKGFEVIEAHHLYDVSYDNIDVLIHPQSIIHSLVEFKDNSMIAQAGLPSMKIPIQYALSYPERFPRDDLKLDLAKMGGLDFSEPDLHRFPCLGYAYSAGKTGGSMPALMNAANEIAVKHFLAGRIPFMKISETIKQMMDSHSVLNNPDLYELMDIDKNARKKTEELLT